MARQRIATTWLALLALAAADAAAQHATPSARSFAHAGSFGARARGYEATFWNPANLGLSGGPSWSIGLPGIGAYVNNNSLSYGDISALYGEFIDDERKSELLADIRRDDPNRMFELGFDVGAHLLGISVGRFALAVGTVGGANLEVSPDALELLLFGNVGEAGTGKDFTLEGSEAQAWALSGAALSYAQPFTLPGLAWTEIRFSVGATVKYGVAHGLVHFVDRGSLLSAEPLALDVKGELIDEESADAGRVWSVDLGAAVDWGGDLVVGLSLQNALADISWREEQFKLTQYTVLADFDSTTLADTSFAFAELDPEDRLRVAEFLDETDLPRRLRLSGLLSLGPALNLSADYEEVIGDALRARWQRTVALGAELRPARVLPLRAGLATDFSQLALAGGFGLYLGPAHADLAIGRWGIVGGDGVVVAFSLSIWPGPGF